MSCCFGVQAQRIEEAPRDEMPDRSFEREREDCLERYAAGAHGGSLGFGVRQAPNKQSYIVEIRPPGWNNKNLPCKFWKGKISHRGLAKYYADAIAHYCGKARCHFGTVGFSFPPLKSLERSTPEERSRYVRAIAGDGYRDQRQGFIDQVMKVIESDKGFILQGYRFLRIAPPAPVLPPPATELAPVAEAAADSSLEDCDIAFEEDRDGVASVAQSASISQGASFAVFGLNMGRVFDERILESVAQPLGPERYNPKDCPSDKDKDWDTTLKELNKKSAVADPNAVGFPAPVFENISFVPGTNFVERHLRSEAACSYPF